MAHDCQQQQNTDFVNCTCLFCDPRGLGIDLNGKTRMKTYHKSWDLVGFE